MDTVARMTCVRAAAENAFTEPPSTRVDGVEKYRITGADAGDLPANEASDDDDDDGEEGRAATCPRMRRATTTPRKST